jgi:hypothetical protein
MEQFVTHTSISINQLVFKTHSEMMADFSEEQPAKAAVPIDSTDLSDMDSAYIK